MQIFVYLGMFMAIAVSSHARVENFVGRAVNTNGELEFIEEHSVRYINGQIASLETTYFDPDYKKIGEIRSNFSAGSRFGSYEFKDERLAYVDGAKVFADQIMVYSQKTPQGRVKKKHLKRDSDQILGQGFHPFIQENFEALLQGKVFGAKLVLPSQMDQFRVRICPVKVENGRLTLRIDLDSWFLRLFAPAIEAEYEIGTRRLVAYRGVSAISNTSGKNVSVTISYSYPQQSTVAVSR
jgi:hypothetical protein